MIGVWKLASLQPQVTTAFESRFGERPSHIVHAPGRVNLIGEHTDYNDGFVLPMVIDRAVWIALRPTADAQVRIHSLDFDETAEFSLTSYQHEGEHWLEYIKGVTYALQGAGYKLRGWEGVMAGNVPRGAGLSSSAALEVAVARAFTAVANLNWDAAKMAQLAQKAENEWVGVNCGIMDQMVSAAGRPHHALLIDCRSLKTELVKLPEGTAVVILDTNTRRGLLDSAYNERRQQCETAAAFFGVPALRDVSLAEFEAKADGLETLIRQRARHVITENERVLTAVEAMRHNDPTQLGQLMNASHLSLRDDYAVSSHELNVVVEIAQAQIGCYGARMTGAGFGGCAVALVQTGATEAFVQNVAAEYESATQINPNIYTN
jgi:galactokinase